MHRISVEYNFQTKGKSTCLRDTNFRQINLYLVVLVRLRKSRTKTIKENPDNSRNCVNLIVSSYKDPGKQIWRKSHCQMMALASILLQKHKSPISVRRLETQINQQPGYLYTEAEAAHSPLILFWPVFVYQRSKSIKGQVEHFGTQNQHLLSGLSVCSMDDTLL